MQRQAQDDSAQEAAIELAAKLDAQRRQEDANRRAAARAQLLAEVVQGREQQIALHERLRYCTHWNNTFERQFCTACTCWGKSGTSSKVAVIVVAALFVFSTSQRDVVPARLSGL